ncbi:ribonuclease H1-like [Styela clava]
MGLRKSGIGVYWGRDNHPLNVSIPHGGSKLTSSRAEIAASHAAILLAKAFKIEKLLLHTDSDTLVKSCNHWLPMWQHNDWKSRSTNRPILNQDMWKKLTEDLLHVLVDFHHSSDCIEGIKKAHKLAQEGANAS